MSAILLHFLPMSADPNRIRALRIERGLSQQELADLAGCSKMQISGLERGRPRLDILWMQRLAAPLGVAPGDLLLATDNPNAAIDDDERRLIGLFRATPDPMRKQMLAVGEAMAQMPVVDVDRAA